MGAVYRATDTKLNREVAIKVLPDALANDPDYLARFTREAQVLASLNHENIAIIHGVEEQALVMELVHGQTLEERIRRGSHPAGGDTRHCAPDCRSPGSCPRKRRDPSRFQAGERESHA
jgi:serine/threonine protein kinase